MVANIWPAGFEEDFKGLDYDTLVSAIGELRGSSVLEIGCGNGRWTSELLVSRFDKVVAVDVIDAPTYTGFEYHKVSECKLPFEDKSFDCVYSHGVFCHLPLSCQLSYLKEVRRVMRSNGLIMLANWKRHHNLKGLNGVEFVDDWYYNDTEITNRMMIDAGLSWDDYDLENRDTLAIVW